jgi:hypothetical protein
MQQLTLADHCAQVLRGDLEAAIADAGDDSLAVQRHAHLRHQKDNAAKPCPHAFVQTQSPHHLDDMVLICTVPSATRSYNVCKHERTRRQRTE